MIKIKKKDKPVRGFKDTFNFKKIQNLKFVSDMELPRISAYKGPLPQKLINILRRPTYPNEYFVHHYLFDYTFDGRNGVWYGCIENSKKEKAYVAKMSKYMGVISPDYSVYVDLPLAHQIWNIYRDRVTCEWLRSLGLNVIFNLRWGDYRTYKYVFAGIEKHSVISVGSHGLIKHPENRNIFMNGFKEMIRRVEPATLVIYGPLINEMNELCDKAKIQIIHFDCEQVEARKENH